METHTYFASYHYATPAVHGFSTVSITLARPLETFDDIQAMTKMIEDIRTDGATVVILYWREIAASPSRQPEAKT